MGLKPVTLMLICTLLLAAAQFFQKTAGERLELSIQGFVFNWPFWVGLLLAGLAAIVMTMALRKGELSKIFPLVSLSFVWTVFIAVIFFGEVLTIAKVVGVALVIAGVVVLGRTGVGA